MPSLSAATVNVAMGTYNELAVTITQTWILFRR